jgi:hypothetical protein
VDYLAPLQQHHHYPLQQHCINNGACSRSSELGTSELSEGALLKCFKMISASIGEISVAFLFFLERGHPGSSKQRNKVAFVDAEKALAAVKVEDKFLRCKEPG